MNGEFAGCQAYVRVDMSWSSHETCVRECGHSAQDEREAL
jgi:hypothetical protein